jgi:hypothetical protein
MKKHENPFHIKATLPICVAVIVAWGVGVSLSTGDPHWLNRSGALVAAIAAAAILLQIKSEIELEEERTQLEAKAEDARDSTASGPLNRLEIQLTLKRLEVHRNELTRQRLSIASFVIGTAMVGELLHGFGDLLICYALRVCTAH